MSVALILLMGLRVLLYQVLSLTTVGAHNRGNVIWNFFDLILFPLFVVYFSIVQCVFLFGGFNPS